MSQIAKIMVQPNKEDTQNPTQEKAKKRPIDVSLKVWKEVVKSYENSNARRKSGEVSIQVFEFAHKIISKFINDFYIIFVHS